MPELSGLPVCEVVLAADGRAWVDGIPVRPAADLDAARTAARDHVRRLAVRARRPHVVRAREPDGARYSCVISAEGEVLPESEAGRLPDDPWATEVPPVLAGDVLAVQAAVPERPAEARVLAHGLTLRVERMTGRAHPWWVRALQTRAEIEAATGEPERAVEHFIEAAVAWIDLGYAEGHFEACARALTVWRDASRARRVPDPQDVWRGEQLAAAVRLGGSGLLWLREQVLMHLDGLH
ncbi:hypothetical protein RM574_25640 [Streptomyces sp. DSM 41982]|uniref:Uncharacterized protein n=1 Tax=Streptomyces evansiae TaxID=3075535 RepID=A0ABD5ECT2_9ACTN|nr:MULTISPECIES: hypothetical protein [unclassified Streptomyces]MDT0418868.1 hypothetical protein [Streptomyces sp. DSM 41982]SCE23823.1 hypothetical protein GA0115246_112922 [Streptomyces sp. SolWspMP-sol7th]